MATTADQSGTGMRRRNFLALLGGGTASITLPLFAGAQQAGTVGRIGILRIGSPPPSFIEPLRKALAGLGRVEGKNIVLEYGIAQNVDQLAGLAADLIGRKVDVLIASGTPAVLPARHASSMVPIVFVAAIDPVATGVVDSLARPGGNVT